MRSGACDGVVSHREIFSPERGGFPSRLFGDDFDWDGFEQRFRDGPPLVFFDIETGGLGDVLIFLVGLLSYAPARAADGSPGSRRFCFESFLAVDPSGEPGVLVATAQRLDPSACWVSFNGKSFDLPRLRKRGLRHGVSLPDCLHHVDLLHEVRRRWKDELPDCRLSTVERRLLGLERDSRDVPGREVPDRYWDFVTTGVSTWIEPVEEHNRRDVLAMAALARRMAQADPSFRFAGE